MTDTTAHKLALAYPLAHRDGFAALVGLLVFKGQMCPKCLFATRATSKRWARCKRCNVRVERYVLPPKP